MNIQIPKVGRWLKDNTSQTCLLYILKNINGMAYVLWYYQTYQMINVTQTVLNASEVTCLSRHTINQMRIFFDVNDFKVDEDNKMGDVFIYSCSEYGVFLDDRIYLIFSKYIPTNDDFPIRFGSSAKATNNVHIIGNFRKRLINGILPSIRHERLTRNIFDYMVRKWKYQCASDKRNMLHYALTHSE